MVQRNSIGRLPWDEGKGYPFVDPRFFRAIDLMDRGLVGLAVEEIRECVRSNPDAAAQWVRYWTAWRRQRYEHVWDADRDL